VNSQTYQQDWVPYWRPDGAGRFGPICVQFTVVFPGPPHSFSRLTCGGRRDWTSCAWGEQKWKASTVCGGDGTGPANHLPTRGSPGGLPGDLDCDNTERVANPKARSAVLMLEYPSPRHMY